MFPQGNRKHVVCERHPGAPSRRAPQRLPLLPCGPHWTPKVEQEYKRDSVSLAALVRGHGMRELLLAQAMAWRGDLRPQEQQASWLLRYADEGRAPSTGDMRVAAA